MSEPEQENISTLDSCNIGLVEIRRRYRNGFIGLGLMVTYIFFVEWFELPAAFRFGLFIPAFYAVSGFLQALKRFCYVYGWKGLASLTGRRKFTRITEAEQLKQDRTFAISLVMKIIFYSLLITAFYLLVS